VPTIKVLQRVMTIKILIVAFSLALDAAGVAMAIGCGTNPDFKEKSSIVFSFGFFQFLFALIGALIGHYIDLNFFTISDYFSGTVLLILGIYLIIEGYQSEEECIYTNLSLWTIIILGISVSIDALGAGFSILFEVNYLTMIFNALVIGLTASALTAFAFKVILYIKHIAIVERYASYLGGIILVLLSLNIMFA
jgi:putative Mn2+ efflux pump MntP